jgi:hypothetical protein
MISPSGSLHLSRVMSPQEKAARAPSIRGLNNSTPTCVSKIGLKDVVALTKKMWRYVLVTLLKRLIHHAWGNICQRRPRKHIWWCLMRQRKEIHGLGNGFKNLCPSKKPARLWFDNWQNLWIFAKIIAVTSISAPIFWRTKSLASIGNADRICRVYNYKWYFRGFFFLASTRVAY